MKVLMDIILAGIMKAHSFITFVLLTLLVNMGMACPIVLEQGHHSGIFKGQTYDEIDSSIGVVDISDDRANWVESKNESGINSDVLVYESSDAARSSSTLFKSTDNLIGAAGKLTKGKSGYIGSVKGNADEIFNSLTQGATKLESGAYKLNNGTILNLHKSTTTQLPTISINQGGRITKIRITQ